MFRKSFTFRGGVHPRENKFRTEHLAIESLPIPGQVVIPLLQHIGTPAEPIVRKGDRVKVGQLIGEAKKFVSVPIHASLGGIVVVVEPRPHPLGIDVLSVVIDRDETDQMPAFSKDPEWKTLSVEEMKFRILQSGIVGMGGAGFPTHVKLSPPPDKKIDRLIINGAECEPYLTSDHRMMIEQTDEILGGVRILGKILNVKEIIIGIEANKQDALKRFRKKTAGLKKIQVFVLRVKYPQGGEKQLIKAVTGREVPSGGLPMDVGCIVQNVGTAQAVYEAVCYRKPLIERVVTVTGPGVIRPGNIRVRIGTPIREIIAFCGGLAEPAAKLVHGGPMMGISQYTDTVPVIKGTSGILVLDKKTANQPPEKPCISCARCVDVCPMRLMPNRIATLVEYAQHEAARLQGLFDCMECGSCSFICPARRNLVQYIKLGKAVCTNNTKIAS
ncbi:MAG TPA: electron transport complex subunit RsxC [bacterium]|nr:electron transport complex subunit RsxC [bacterium]